MKKLIYIVPFILCELFIVNSNAQNYADNQFLDSLKNELTNPNIEDSMQIILLHQIGENTPIFRVSYWDSLLQINNHIIQNFKNKQHPKIYSDYKARAINNIGYIYENEGAIDKAVKNYLLSLKIQNKIGDKEGEAQSYNNLGFVEYNRGNIEGALKYYHKSIKIRESINDATGMAQSYNNIGLLYKNQNEIELALEYYTKSLKKYELIDSKYGQALVLINIGMIKERANDLDGALQYYNHSLKLREEIGDKAGTAIAFNNIGGIYKLKGDFPKALSYYQNSLEIRKAINNKPGMATSYDNIGGIYLKLNDVKAAKENGLNSLNISKEIGFPTNILYAAILMCQVYEKELNYKSALDMYKLHIQMRDSLNNEETQKSAAKQQAQYEYEKQKAVDDAEHEKQIAIEQEAKEKQQVITYATGGGLMLVGIFLVFVFNRLQVTRKQKNIIEIQKQEVETQKEVVELAHSELEEKNQEIMDSINYAKRIQNAILPPLKVVKEYLQESFILYKPKDIVAGDFYWLEHKEDKILFAAADCTGHGVPGAMVSVVCNNGLNRSIREYGLTEPGEILNKTREIVIAEFEKSEEEVKDGMDIALCSLEGNTLKYAGANNPLWIIRDGEIIETKADKQPIGKFDELLPYKTHTFELQKGDSIYIFSDGYVDQFGGEKGKKFKAKAFRELLLSSQDSPMEEQRTIIDNAFENWRGNLEQIDDVCVIGVRI
ncbi:tetratricopeptide repeat protein [Vicingus serpentipes]|uniref:Tetratricopeptide repeat protein n=1 Tax=Vicingus serpentipes TaxID=1926625 RepID=A0A5C6RR95_9FLAO|nr:tetratricopeptide repeat protein [Vicingus serpentipes]TXB64798.1 tetratricopeptide repeat protein [Vicingus serpentipes]